MKKPNTYSLHFQISIRADLRVSQLFTYRLKLTGVDVFGKVRVKVTDVQISITELHLAYTFEKLQVKLIVVLMITIAAKRTTNLTITIVAKRQLI